MAKTKANMKNKQQSNKQIQQIKQVVNSIIPAPEFKYFDQVVGVSPTQSGTITNISDITRGDQVTQRIGNEVMLKNIELRIACNINPNVELAYLRYIILVDKMGYNAPVVGDVLETSFVGTGYTHVIPYQWDYRKRFNVRHDEVIALVKNGPGAAFSKRLLIPLNFKSYNIGSATTFKNQVYILIIGQEANVLDLSTFTYYSRITFTDD